MTVSPASLANLKRGGGPGRPPGTPNKLTTDLREAILEAATSGHTDGLVGYYSELKLTLPEAFAAAMLRLLPKEFNVSGSITMAHASVAELASAFPPELIALASLDWRALSEPVRARMAGLLSEARAVGESGAVEVIDVTPEATT